MDIHRCDTPVRADHCRWLATTGLAWLDAVVRDRREVSEWLAEDALATLTGGRDRAGRAVAGGRRRPASASRAIATGQDAWIGLNQAE
jgi:hypothetical protein